MQSAYQTDSSCGTRYSEGLLAMMIGLHPENRMILSASPDVYTVIS